MPGARSLHAPELTSCSYVRWRLSGDCAPKPVVTRIGQTSVLIVFPVGRKPLYVAADTVGETDETGEKMQVVMT